MTSSRTLLAVPETEAQSQRSRIATIGTAIAWILAIGLLTASAGLALASKSTYIVTSGSMTPAIHPGDALFVRPVDLASLEVGDVITFRVPGRSEIITHRIHAIDDEGFQTKGDFNADPDPWQIAPDQVIGEVRFVVPKVGLYLSHIRSSGAGFLFVTVPLVLLLVFQSRVVVVEWKKWRESTGAQA